MIHILQAALLASVALAFEGWLNVWYWWKRDLENKYKKWLQVGRAIRGSLGILFTYLLNLLIQFLSTGVS
jgi:hypothetical protein